MKVSHYKLISELRNHLTQLFPDAFISSDLSWYPVKNDPQICIAPDLWIDLGGMSPPITALTPTLTQKKEPTEYYFGTQIIFDIISTENHNSQFLAHKLLFYQQFGVQEYYLYDLLEAIWYGYHGKEGLLQPIVPLANWVSPRLRVQFLPPQRSNQLEWEIKFPDGSAIYSPKLSLAAIYDTYDATILPQMGQHTIGGLLTDLEIAVDY
jgi:hypothetical protein